MKSKTCYWCNGTGYEELGHTDIEGNWKKCKVECGVCKGTGKVAEDKK